MKILRGTSVLPSAASLVEVFKDLLPAMIKLLVVK